MVLTLDLSQWDDGDKPHVTVGDIDLEDHVAIRSLEDHWFSQGFSHGFSKSKWWFLLRNGAMNKLFGMESCTVKEYDERWGERERYYNIIYIFLLYIYMYAH